MQTPPPAAAPPPATHAPSAPLPPVATAHPEPFPFSPTAPPVGAPRPVAVPPVAPPVEHVPTLLGHAPPSPQQLQQRGAPAAAFPLDDEPAGVPRKGSPLVVVLALGALFLVGVVIAGGWWLVGQRRARAEAAQAMASASAAARAAAAAQEVAVASAAPPTGTSPGESPGGAAAGAPPEAPKPPEGAPATEPEAPKPARVTLSCAPECGTITCDGKEVTLEEGALVLPAGKHLCKVEREGHLPLELPLTLTAGETREEKLALVERPKQAARPVTPPTARPAAPAGKPPASKPPAAKKCGTFINPCR